MLKNLLREASFWFASGVVGALVYCIISWGAGEFRIPRYFSIDWRPKWTATWVVFHLIYGGVFSWLFLLRFRQDSWFIRGAIYALAPTFIQIFIILPFFEKEGFLGQDLGFWIPLYLYVLNSIWAWTTALWRKNLY